MASTRINDVINIGHKANGEAYVVTEAGGGWLLLSDSPQDLRIWACAAAIWAARRAGAAVNATLHYETRVDVGDNAYFTSVHRIHLLT